LSKLSDERIDQYITLKPMSCNVEGHEDRMQAHCERVQREYFDKGLNNNAGRPKKA